MRRAIICLSAISMLAGATALARPQHPATASHAPPPRSNEPPHSWLFGTWTGGLFPVLDGMTEQDCRTQPTVAFAKDEVIHASLTSTTMSERVIETVRTTAEGAEFRFTPAAGDTTGFGCDTANVLYVARQTDNIINFPRCAAFPYPLQRCAGLH
jgi:hypothetical protein